MLAGNRVDGGEDGLPPGLGILLGPAGAGALDGQWLACLCDQALVAVKEHRLDRGGADVDSEIHD